MNDLRPYLDDEGHGANTFSEMAQAMRPSKILVIAYEVRDRIQAGARVAPFTVGDFDPRYFQAPPELKAAIAEAVQANQTNYPPADGLPELRSAIRDHYARHLGLDYPIDAVTVASGARPVLYGAFRCLVSPGEKVVTPAPSWNNANFAQLVGAQHVNVPTRPEDGFMPTAEALAPHLRDARLLVLCSPMNPAGTMMREGQLRDICALVLEENARRRTDGERALYLVYDHVYRLLTFGDQEHVTPVGVMPEMARYTLFSDAISKCFAATGLRVGWMVGPPAVMGRMKALLTHVGAWAPRPEQVAAARMLGDDEAMTRFLVPLRAGLRARLDLLYDAFEAWRVAGLPVRAIAPEGALYLSVHFDLEGRPGLPDEDAVRRYLLREAGCAIVPFSAFGDTHNRGWVRFSIGSVSLDDIHACLPRLRVALQRAVDGAGLPR